MTGYYVALFVKVVALLSIIVLPWIMLACVVWWLTH